MTCRRTFAVLLAAAAAAASAVIGNAASLPVSSAKLDSFAANQAAPTTTTIPGDATAPQLDTLQMLDINANGKVDQVIATFNEPLQASTSTSGWVVTGAPSGAALASVAVVGGSNQAKLTLTEGSGDPDTAVGTFQVELKAAASDIKDPAGNTSSFDATSPTDKARPVALTAEYFDDNTNAKIDQIKVTYSEDLTATTATAPWTISGGPGGLTTSDMSANIAITAGPVITLPFSETNGTPTATTTVATTPLTLTLDNASEAVRDRATVPNTAVSFSRVTTDRANPIPLSLNIPNGTGTNNKATQGDSVVVAWSEPLLASTICTSGFSDTQTQTYDANDAGAKISVVNGAASDSVEALFDCGTFRFGTLSLGSTAYTTETRTFAANPNNDRSKATWAPSTATFTLTLGKLVGSDVLGTVNPPAPNPAPTATYTPDSGLTDPSGNPATSSATKIETHF